MPFVVGTIPKDPGGARSASGYSQNVGVVPIQLDSATADQSGQSSAPMNGNLAQGGSAFGTVANPTAVNQVVGTPIYATTTLTAGATANASLAATTGKTTYINGFYVEVGMSSSGTPSGQVTLSLDGGVTTHMNFTIAVSTTFAGVVNVDFPDPIPATAANTTIVVTSPTLTNGGNGSISLFGYQL